MLLQHTIQVITMGDFNTQDIAKTAWAFARLNRNDGSLFAAIATAAGRRMGDFDLQGFANTA